MCKKENRSDAFQKKNLCKFMKKLHRCYHQLNSDEKKNALRLTHIQDLFTLCQKATQEAPEHFLLPVEKCLDLLFDCLRLKLLANKKGDFHAKMYQHNIPALVAKTNFRTNKRVI